MEKVFLSVVIPFYNSIKTAKESVNSVVKEIENLYADKTLAKSFLLENTVSEIICCNDGSTDGTTKFLDGISYRDFGTGKSAFIQIKVMHLKNSGAASARNAGLRVCRGQFIAFNDSDDKWLNGSLAKRLSILNDEPNAVCITANHERDVQRIPKLNKSKTYVSLFYITLNDELFKNYYTTQNSILKRKVIDDGIFFKEGMCYSEEIYFFCQIANKYKCLFLNEKMSESILHKQRFGESGLSGNLFAMERGELKSLSLAHKELGVSFFRYAAACIYSVAKYFRRVFIVKLRNSRARVS
ncbi:MAG: glycosyltransferase family 2 protein [Treponema sp.]